MEALTRHVHGDQYSRKETSMYDCTRNFINGQWLESASTDIRDLVNPANGESIGKIRLRNTADVALAVAAAREAFKTYSQWTVPQRVELLGRILEAYQARYDEFAAAITAETGAHGIEDFLETKAVMGNFTPPA